MAARTSSGHGGQGSYGYGGGVLELESKLVQKEKGAGAHIGAHEWLGEGLEAQTTAIVEVERRRPKEGDEVDPGDVVHSISIQSFQSTRTRQAMLQV